MTALDTHALTVAPGRWAPVVEGLCGLKGLQVAGREGSLADALFLRAWGALARGVTPELVAMATTAQALAATRLGGIDVDVLSEVCGLGEEAARGTLRAALEDALDGRLAAKELAWLAGALVSPAVAADDVADAPQFACRLAEQPRAGVTAPGLPRLPLDPSESHAEHCLSVAAAAALLALAAGGDPAEPFLCGLAHHLHNAWLPDAGFAGEALIGEAALAQAIETLRDRALAELAPEVAERVARALRLTEELGDVPGQAFGAADVLDRVLQLRRYERQARFRLPDAVDRYAIVHAGPAQGFGLTVLDAAGLR